MPTSWNRPITSRPRRWPWSRRTIKEHKRIIFNGDGYSEEWEKEAERRGLYNLRSTVDALPHMLSAKNIKLMNDFGVLSPAEIRARFEVSLESYSKILNIEALTMLEMRQPADRPGDYQLRGKTGPAPSRSSSR